MAFDVSCPTAASFPIQKALATPVAYIEPHALCAHMWERTVQRAHIRRLSVKPRPTVAAVGKASANRSRSAATPLARTVQGEWMEEHTFHRVKSNSDIIMLRHILQALQIYESPPHFLLSISLWLFLSLLSRRR